jgi:hypothetical protein
MKMLAEQAPFEDPEYSVIQRNSPRTQIYRGALDTQPPIVGS